MTESEWQRKYDRLLAEYDFAFGGMLEETDDPEAPVFRAKALQAAYEQGFQVGKLEVEQEKKKGNGP